MLHSPEHDEPASYTGFDRVLLHRTTTRKEIDFVGTNFGGVAIESRYVDGRWRGGVQTLLASPWRGIIVTRSELNLDDPQVQAVPTALLAWFVDV